MHTQLPKYRVEIWVEIDGCTTIRSCTIRNDLALVLFCGAIAIIATSSPRNLPQVAAISTLH